MTDDKNETETLIPDLFPSDAEYQKAFTALIDVVGKFVVINGKGGYGFLLATFPTNPNCGAIGYASSVPREESPALLREFADMMENEFKAKMIPPGAN